MISYSVFGQISVSGRVIDGRVIDGSGEPMRGFTIKVKDTLQGTVTDFDGKFTIEVKEENTILVFERHNTDNPLEIKASEIDGDIFLYKNNSNTSVCINYSVVDYHSLTISYWGGLFYNPYGIKIHKDWYLSKERNNEKYFSTEIGYRTNFRNNSDFYGRLATEIVGQYIYYTFQQTIIDNQNTQNKITTHLLEGNSDLKYFGIMYGIGYQQFERKGIKNNLKKNWGTNIGIARRIKYIGLLYFKSFYWQDYWAWEANLNKSIYYKKLRLNTAISYRQTTHHFKEINLTLGYIF